MNHDDVIEQVLYFLRLGRFKADRPGDRLYYKVPRNGEEAVYKYG